MRAVGHYSVSNGWKVVVPMEYLVILTVILIIVWQISKDKK